MASTSRMFFKEWREATQEELGRKMLLRRRCMKIMVTTTRFYFTECTEAVCEEKSRSKVFTRLESKQQVDSIAMTRRYLLEWKEA
eukprot:2173525-Rhodomonas_salina.1